MEHTLSVGQSVAVVAVGMDYVVVGMDYVVVGMNSVLVAPVNCCSIAYLYSCYLCNTGVAVGAD
jgi:hypothetical protein